MSDDLFGISFSVWVWAIVYSFLAILLFWLPKSLRYYIVIPLRQVLENTIILAYLSDGSDIGFFESFILGADRTKEMVNDVYKILQIHQKANIKERLCVSLPDKRLHDESQYILCSFVQDKKRHVVDILRSRGQIISYLHKRLAVRRPFLYALLWFGYSLLGR